MTGRFCVVRPNVPAHEAVLGNPADRVDGEDAEDYLGTPFDIDELLAPLRALRRRHLDEARRLPVPGGVLDVDTRQVAIAGSPGGAIVRSRVRRCRPGKVFSRAELSSLSFDDAGVETVETYVHHVRRKLGPGDGHGSRPQPSVGYSGCRTVAWGEWSPVVLDALPLIQICCGPSLFRGPAGGVAHGVDQEQQEKRA
jgi:hypothetical protein